MKIAISTSSFGSSDKAPFKVLESKGLEIVSNPFGRKLTETEIIEHLQNVDGLLAGLEPLNANVFNNCPQLKAIARVGIGMDNVDMLAAEKYGIKISNTPVGPTDAVAEMTLASALTLARNIVPANNSLHQKKWVKSIGKGLKNSNVLIVGYGRIGRRVAELFQYFGASVMVCDPVPEESSLAKGLSFVQLKEGIQVADIVSLHAAGNKPIITSKEFGHMKQGVMLLNSARGNLIEEKALLGALDSGKVASAWLDTFAEEPYSGKLTEYEQMLLTPHMSTYSVQCRKDMEMSAVNNIIRDLDL